MIHSVIVALTMSIAHTPQYTYSTVLYFMRPSLSTRNVSSRWNKFDIYTIKPNLKNN